MDWEVVDKRSGRTPTLDAALITARPHDRRPLSDGTRRGYARDLASFVAWCKTQAVAALPVEPHALAAYLEHLARTDRPATIGRKLAAIVVAHRDAGLESPTTHGTVKRTMAAIRREKGTAPNRKSALLVDDLKRIVAPLGDSLLEHRDRALLLLGFGAALRRTELVALRIEQLRFEEQGLVLTLPHSKPNREPQFEVIAVARGSELMTCPVRAVCRWVATAGIIAGPLFRGLTPQGGLRRTPLGDRMVAHIVKRRCKAVGIDPSAVAGNSLRRGFANAAAQARKPIHTIQRHGRWKSTAMLELRVEDGTRWEENASRGIGL